MIDKHYLQCHFFSQAEDDGKGKKQVSRTYKISEAARSLKVPTSTLRYWETVFPDHLHPVRTRGGQRAYTEEDMGALRRIHFLLHTQRMTMEGARKVLDGQPMPDALPPAAVSAYSGDVPAMGAGEGAAAPDAALLAGIVQELKEIRDALAPCPEGEVRT